MKRIKRSIAVAAILCAIALIAFAAGYTGTVDTEIWVDGQRYVNQTHFEWEMVEAPVQAAAFSFTAVDESGAAIDGASFSLTDAALIPIPAAEGTARGVFTYENLLPGVYTLTQTAAPVGYVPPKNTVWSVSISEGGEVSVTGDGYDPDAHTITQTAINGIKWDGTDPFSSITYPEEGDIGVTPYGAKYIRNQLSFVAEISGEIGSEFEAVRQLMAQYGFRIIGYNAIGAFYQVESVHDVSYEELASIQARMDSEALIISGTTAVALLTPVSSSYTVSEKKGTWYTSSSRLWYGDVLDEENPGGKNWGMEYIRMPSVWKLDPIMNTIRCSVIEINGCEENMDLSYTVNIHDGTDRDNPGSDIAEINHGTHVAGIVAANHNDFGVSGVFHNASLVGIDYGTYPLLYDNMGMDASEIFPAWLCHSTGVAIATGNQGQEKMRCVINQSFGFPYVHNLNSIRVESDREEQRIRNEWLLLYSRGEAETHQWTANNRTLAQQFAQHLNNYLKRGYDFVLCHSAGNDYNIARLNTNCNWLSNMITEPQEIVDRIMVVGAFGIDPSGRIGQANFSKPGDRVDILAPGVDIYSTYTNDCFGYMSGTSMAAPHAAGVAAAVWSIDPKLSGADVKQLVVNSTAKYLEPDSGDVFRTADNDYPVMDAWAAVEAARNRARKSTVSGSITDSGAQSALAGTRIQILEGSKLIAETTADASGSYTLSVKPGVYTLLANHSGYMEASKDIAVKSGESIRVELKLQQIIPDAGVVSGKVVDQTGAPLEGVLVSLENSSVSAATAADGSFTLTLPVGRMVLSFTKNGYSPESRIISVFPETANDAGTIAMQEIYADVELSGTVTCAQTGVPLPGASVRLTANGQLIAEMTADQSGLYSFMVQPGEYSVCASLESYEENTAEIAVQPKTPARLDIGLAFAVTPVSCFTWRAISDTEAAITGYTGDFALVRIPDVIEGRTVTAIDKAAFANNQAMQKVVMPDSITTIASSAFALCANLEYTNIPKSWMTVAVHDFVYGEIWAGCSKLTSITVPEGMVRLPDYAFAGCKDLKQVLLPSTLEMIGYRSFASCTGIRNQVFPDGLKEIGQAAFDGCRNLQNPQFPDSLKVIGIDAFVWCTSITELTLPDSITTIGIRAFRNCQNLASTTIPLNWTSIMQWAGALPYGEIWSNTKITRVVVPEGIVNLPDLAFDDCTTLTEIVLPSTLETVGKYAFRNCTGLKTISLPDSVHTIGGLAFDGCANLSSIRLPEAWNAVAGSLSDHWDTYGNIWRNCSSLTTVTIPAGAALVPTCAFRGCSYITKVELPSTVTSIGVEAFAGCTGLRSLVLPKNVHTISKAAFRGCTDMVVTIPADTTSIHADAFKDCSNVTAIVEKGSYAESYCIENGISYQHSDGV